MKALKEALAGIRILDLTRLLPGPYCTMLLADMGADVLKIEEPSIGDPFRRYSPVMSGGESMQFMLVNRNKRSMTLNLKKPRGREIFMRLAEKTDVVVEQFRPGVVARLGVDYESVCKVNPRIVYCSISGYGQDGPYRLVPGHDINYQACSGWMSVTRTPDGVPMHCGNLVADMAGGGLFPTIAILSGLMALKLTGQGQYLDVSMMDTMVHMMMIHAGYYFGTGTAAEPGTFRQSGIYPFYKTYQCRDGKYLTLGCSEHHLWANVCRVFGREDYIPHQFPEGRQREEMLEFFQQTFLTRDRDEWLRVLEDANICVAPVLDMAELFKHPQVIHRKLLDEVEHPAEGRIPQLGFPFKMTATPGLIKTPPPLKGQHTDEVLRRMGYRDEEIRSFHQEEVV
ncbi:MAG: CoA transferase [Deltaproteobacteria bacterium]|nr:CoA transferase [Deltaproteobacteria bacterium]MBW2307891.1 CoA transferase [Deltaproteobacteria bacterium]